RAPSGPPVSAISSRRSAITRSGCAIADDCWRAESFIVCSSARASSTIGLYGGYDSARRCRADGDVPGSGARRLSTAFLGVMYQDAIGFPRPETVLTGADRASVGYVGGPELRESCRRGRL